MQFEAEVGVEFAMHSFNDSIPEDAQPARCAGKKERNVNVSCGCKTQITNQPTKSSPFFKDTS
jgi:hypothetical protein